MKTYKITNKIKYSNNHGAFSFICREPELLDQLRADYGRENIAAKVFFRPLANAIDHDNLEMLLNNFIYGHYFIDEDYTDRASRLVDAVKVQNIYAVNNLAPRVYGIDLLEYDGLLFPMVVTDDLGITSEWDVRQVAKLWANMEKIAEKYGFVMGYFDGNIDNVVAGKWVDFQGFTHVDNYVDKLKSRAQDKITWSTNHYQSIPQLGVDGFRKTNTRLKELGLDKIDFNGKSVLDVGCSGGQFCMYAADNGAKHVMGIDLPEVIEATQELATYLGYYNIDWVGLNLNNGDKVDFKADVTLYLSMYMHVGLLEWVVNQTNETLIFETNGISEQDAKDILGKYFKEIKTVGYASDFDGRSIIHCYGKK